jgi:hypothetical protein
MASRRRARRELPPIDDRIDAAFADYDETISLLDSYASTREHPNELAILACARVDALANLAARGKSQRERFISFTEEFSGKRSLLQEVALPNLYFGLVRHYETTFLTLETPGRIQLFDREEEMPYIRFLAASGLPLTERDVVRFLQWFSIEIQRHYRTTATQNRAKPTLDTRDAVVGHLRDAASRRRDKAYLRATESLDGFVRDYQVEAILYREVRSGAIHSFEFGVNEERFFAEPDLFVDTVRRGYDTTLYLSVEFSAAWLIDLLRDCLRNYKDRLKASRRLPPSLWGEICDPDSEVEMFDDSLLEEPRDIGFAVGR